MPLRIRLTLAICIGLSLLYPSRDAQADDDNTLAWGLLGTELSMAGVFALNFGVEDYPNDGPVFALNFAPLLIGPASAYAAHRFDWGAEPAYAVHGAAALGGTLFLLGGLVDGRKDRSGFRIGNASLALGAMGAVGGAWLGATKIDSLEVGTAFFAAPVAGLVVGGLVGILSAVISSDSNKAMSRAAMGAVGGLTLGIGGSLIFAQTSNDTNQSTSRVVPGASASAGQYMFSFGGTM